MSTATSNTTTFAPLVLGTRITGLILHTAGCAMLVSAIIPIAKRLHKNRTYKFWGPAFASLVLLLATCVIEMTFLGSYFNSFRSFAWLPGNTLLGDITVRLGLMLAGSVRFFRLYLVVTHAQWKRVPILGIFLVVLFMTIALGVIIELRSYQLALLPIATRNRTPEQVARLAELSANKNVVTFVCFLMAMLLMVVADIAFVFIIATSSVRSGDAAKKLAKRQVFIPVIINLIIAFIYMVFMILIRFDWDTQTLGTFRFMTTTLQRFAPAVGAWVFFQFTVPQSQHLLQHASRSGSAAGSSQSGAQVASVPSTSKIGQATTTRSGKGNTSHVALVHGTNTMNSTATASSTGHA